MVLPAGGEVSRISDQYCSKKPVLSGISAEEMKWRLLLPGASEPRLTELNPSGL
jgi:hypothetical protein